MNKIIKIIGSMLWLAVIIAGLYGIYQIVPDLEIATGFLTISFGILAVIWAFIARSNLSIGSSLRDYSTSFFLCLLFILLFSIWDTAGRLFLWQGILIFPKYAFIIIAYLIFAFAAYKIWKIGKEFGFKEQAGKIERIIKEKKARKK